MKFHLNSFASSINSSGIFMNLLYQLILCLHCSSYHILSIWVRASWIIFWTAKLLRRKESLHECALKITGWHAQFKICRSAKSFLVKLTVPLNRGQFCQQPTRLNEFPEIFSSKTAFKILWILIMLCLASSVLRVLYYIPKKRSD